MVAYLGFIAKELEIYHAQEGVEVSARINQEELRIVLEQVISELIRYIGKEAAMDEIENAMQ